MPYPHVSQDFERRSIVADVTPSIPRRSDRQGLAVASRACGDWAAPRGALPARSDRAGRRAGTRAAPYDPAHTLDSFGTGRGTCSARGLRELTRVCRPAEPGRRGGRRQRAGRQAARQVVLVVRARRHIVRRIRVEQRGEQLDLPAADAQLPEASAVHGPPLPRAARVDLEQRLQFADARRLELHDACGERRCAMSSAPPIGAS